MADFSALKTAIQTYIKQNGNEEITGEILQEILLSVVTTLGDTAINNLVTALADEVAARQNADGTLQQNITNEATARGNADTALQGLINGVKNNVDNGYVYVGIATPSSTPVTGKVFYLALTAGTYTNFGSTVVSQGINILKYNGSAWSLDAFIGIDDTPTPNSPKLVKSGGTFDSIMTDGSAFDISAHFASGGTLATYADLSAALTALNTLSASYKRGGMSIKFVQSSDNKYTQARLMADAFTTDVTQWQVVDNYPTFGSNNLVKSGGVYKEFSQLDQEVQGVDTGLRLNLESFRNNVSFLLRQAVKYAAYYDEENSEDNPFVLLVGFYTNFVQVTLTYDHITNYDFRQYVDSAPSGVQSYTMKNGKKTLMIVIDWSILTSNYRQEDSLEFYIENNQFRYYSHPFDTNIEERVDAIDAKLDGTQEIIGYSSDDYAMQSVSNTVVCPIKEISKDGKLISIYVKSEISGKSKIYIGHVDQLYLFIVRKSYDIDVVAGENIIDVSDMDIYVFAGEQIAYNYVGKRYYNIVSGHPQDEDGFYYGSTSNSLQLEVYANPSKKIKFNVQYTILENDQVAILGKLDAQKNVISALSDEVGYVKSNLNIISDVSGNKYRMMVVNGDVKAFSLNFSHIMAVGNSYTIHPTTIDTGDLATSLWWGHWAMAASRKETAWTTLLQSALRQKDNSAKVTPVFGRRYETGIRALSDNDAFIYWEDNQWKNLKPNVSNFTDVDCVLFFLGDNYTVGSGWYEIYKPMVLQFMSWFPNATIVCCSCRIREVNNEAIAQVANEVSGVYVSMYGLGGASKLGNYVLGDDNNLHQIDNSAVAGHFGDYGEWLILDRIVQAIGYENNAELYNINITNPSGVTLIVKDSSTLAGAIVSVFANISEGTSLSGITVIDEDSNAISVTDHGETDYGRIFTFVMPPGDVTITGI